MKKIIISMLVLSLLMITGCSKEDYASQSEVAALANENRMLIERILVLEDTNAVERVANNLFIQTDNMDWNSLVSDVFTETVYFDMTSVGGTAGEVTSLSIVEGWEQGFMAIEAVQHQSGNMQIEVNGDRATVFQYGTATQYATTDSGSNTRTFFGSYNIGLIKTDDVWKVDAFAFNLKMMDGNINFE